MSEISSTKLEDQLDRLLNDFDTLNQKSTNQENIADFIHDTFRHIHNIKSNLFLIDHNESLNLTYYLENHFEKLRIGDYKISSDSLQLFKKCIDWIKIDISDVDADSAEYSNLLKELKEMKISIDKKEQMTGKLNLSSDEKALLKDARNSGLNIFIVKSDIDIDINREDYRSLPIIKLINQIGMIVLYTPAFKNINKNGNLMKFPLKIIFVTDKKQKELTNPLLKSAKPFEEDLFLNSKDYKILIVEDNPVALLLQRSIMNSFGVCDTVSDGESGLDLFKLALEENSPYNIILLDLVMPGIDGAGVLKKIRELEDFKDIKGLERSKVIVTTTNKDSATLMDLFRAETDAYIIKPLTKEKIVKELNNLKLI